MKLIHSPCSHVSRTALVADGALFTPPAWRTLHLISPHLHVLVKGEVVSNPEGVNQTVSRHQTGLLIQTHQLTHGRHIISITIIIVVIIIIIIIIIIIFIFVGGADGWVVVLSKFKYIP